MSSSLRRTALEWTPRWVIWLYSLVVALISSMRVAKVARQKTLAELETKLDLSKTYDEWKDYALMKDTFLGLDSWKSNPRSPLYDWELLTSRLELLR